MKKNKLILAMYFSVIALSVASVSMSVAWYASSRSLYVNSIDITIDADRMLEISTSKDDGYVEHIDHSELDATGVFLPVTSAHSSEWMSQKKDMPVFYDESLSFEQEDIQTYIECNSGYYSQKFYLKSDDDVWVTLNPEKTFIHSNDTFIDGYDDIYGNHIEGYAETLYNEHHREFNELELNELTKEYKNSIQYFYTQYSLDEFKANLKKLVLAMRFSILVKDENEYSYTIIDPNKSEGEITLLGGILDNDADQFYDYYVENGTNEKKERVYGEVIGDKNLYQYDDALDEDEDFLENGGPTSSFYARHEAEVKRFNLKDSIDNGIEIKQEEAVDLKHFKSSDFHFPVYMNEPKEVVVSIYIEGWDKESVNYTMGAAFISNLSFKIEREM